MFVINTPGRHAIGTARSKMLIGAAGLVLLMATGCGAAGTPGPGSQSGSPAATGQASPGATDNIKLTGAAVNTEAASLWSNVTVPIQPAKGHSIAQEGTVIVAAGIVGGNLVVANSADSGRTWAIHQQGLGSPAPGSLDVALSGDGQHWLVGPPHEGGAGAASTYTKAYVSTAGGALQPITLPGPAAHAAWAGSTLLVSGGAHGSHLWSSPDNGQSFNDISDRVQGTTPPTANSDAPVIGAMLQLNGAAAPVLLAPNGTGSTATAYTTRDGSTFTKAVSVSLPGMQPGALDGLASTYGGNAVIMTARDQLLEITADGQQKTIAMTGLPAGLTTIGVDFRDGANGIANATATTCSNGKSNCTTASSIYTTTDGGTTWALAH
jgi:hypothetical protein